jgi:guanylate kinase
MTPDNAHQPSVRSLAPPEEQRQGLLFVLSGPSGVGKDALLKRMRRRKVDIHFVVTATTRPRRRNEVNGKDYYFVSVAEFEAMRERGDLLENAVYSNNHYGVPKAQVVAALSSGHDAIMRIDVQGAETLRHKAEGIVFIFLCPESLVALRARLLRRREADRKDIGRRMRRAAQEMAEQPKFDYTVVNRTGRLTQAVLDVEAIIRAEKCRTTRRQVSL